MMVIAVIQFSHPLGEFALYMSCETQEQALQQNSCDNKSSLMLRNPREENDTHLTEPTERTKHSRAPMLSQQVGFKKEKDI